MKNKKKVWTIVAGAGATAAVLVPGIVYASTNSNTQEIGKGINVPESNTAAPLPAENKAIEMFQQSALDILFPL